jgi:hypothetical protein
MGRRENEVESIIREQVFIKCFALNTREAIQRGRNMLFRLYLQDYYKMDNMETKRLILYNLIYAERKLENEHAVAKYTIQLKKDMDNTLNYKKDYQDKYCDMLSYYCDCKYIEVSKEEILKYYKFAYKYFSEIYNNIDHSTDNYIRMINMKFNIAKNEKKFFQVLDIIKDLHSETNKKVQSTLEQMLCDIKNIDQQLYFKALTIIENTSKLCV